MRLARMARHAENRARESGYVDNLAMGSGCQSVAVASIDFSFVVRRRRRRRRRRRSSSLDQVLLQSQDFA